MEVPDSMGSAIAINFQPTGGVNAPSRVTST